MRKRLIARVSFIDVGLSPLYRFSPIYLFVDSTGKYAVVLQALVLRHQCRFVNETTHIYSVTNSS